MLMQTIDFVIVILFFILILFIGFITSRRAGTSSSEFFLSGRSMPWWLLGIAMAATTTSTNSANLFTELIRKNGMSGNWVWWAFLITGMLTVFVYAKLWHRTGMTTDIEFYELRYSGKAAAFLRGFRALYLGIFFNVISMALVMLAGIKIGVVMFDISPIKIIVITSFITVVYSMMGGLRGILIAEFIQFILVLVGAIFAAVTVINLPQINGLTNLISHQDIIGKLNFFPDFSNTDLLIAVFIIPVAVQWWSVWYPGSEPGGGGFIAQRMLSAKDEKNSVGATLLFNVVHYGLRPWPWFIIALCSVIVFPDIESLSRAFPNVNPGIMGDDLAYPAMLTFLPHGILGLVVASLLAALISSVSSQLNWGSSYVVNDFYKRFVNTEATEKQLVLAGRISTLLLMVLAASLAPFLASAKRAFDLVLQIGAGTGLIFILRWFWWRINAFSEITAMAVSFIVAFYFEFIHMHTGLPGLAQWQKLLIGIFITTFSWVIITLCTKPAEDKILFRFCRLVRAGGPGWKTVLHRAEAINQPIEGANEKWDVPQGILCMVFACLAVYATLFATGSWIYSYYIQGTVLTVVAIISTLLLLRFWARMYGAKS
jgi:solute:Na+ symporter, SSS family